MIQKKAEGERLILPNIRQQIGFSYAPDFQHEWVHVGLHDVSIHSTEIEYFLEHPEELIRQLGDALEFMHNPKASIWRGCNMHIFQVTAGIHYPLVDGFYGHDGRENDAITITEVDPYNKYTEVAYSHYIRMDKHEQEIWTVKSSIENVIRQQVERGVSQGVAKAIQESTANLAQVTTEKKRIDQQIAELQRERQRIEAIETRLKEREAAKEARKQQPKSRTGYVYVIRSLTALTYYKIGRSATPEKRMKTFDVKIPFEIEPVYLIQTDDMVSLESELHMRFANKRTDGEWFILDKSDLEYIASLQQANQ